jgi:RNA polymerase sigma-70 factor (ECF subfamily)
MDHGFLETVRIFYEANLQALYTYALTLTQCEAAAEDAIQTAICRVLRRGRAPRELRPYLFRCVRNAAIDGLRTNHREQARDAIYRPQHETPGADALALRQEIEQLLHSLPDDERECIVLKVYGGMTFREIAAVRRASLHTVASQYRRALQKMRALCGEQKP